MTIKVVVLMAGALCSKLGKIALEPVSVPVLSLEVTAHGSCYIAPHIRAGKAALLHTLFTLFFGNFGVDSLNDIIFVKVHDEYSAANAYLRSSKTYALSLVKSLMHIIEKLCKLFVKLFHRLANLVENFILIR